jgi:hypothetical protein
MILSTAVRSAPLERPNTMLIREKDVIERFAGNADELAKSACNESVIN